MMQRRSEKPRRPGPAVLHFASNDYPFFGDITRGDYEGHGLRLRWHYVDPPNKLFRQVIRSPRYDITELSLSSYTLLREQGWRLYRALPIFTSRRFRHSGLFVRSDSKIVSGEQLAGKRVGVPDYHMTAAVWIRGFLKDDFGVRPEDIRWVTGRKERVKLPSKVASMIRSVGKEENFFDLLVAKKLDAVIYAHLNRPPMAERKNAPVRTLFPDPVREEKDYFLDHKVFPIMHLLALKEEHLERGTVMARRLEKVLSLEKKRFYEKVGRISSAGILPWFDRYIEETKAVLGGDPWPHGIKANARALNKFLDYAVDQSLLAKRPRLRDLFVDLEQ